MLKPREELIERAGCSRPWRARSRRAPGTAGRRGAVWSSHGDPREQPCSVQSRGGSAVSSNPQEAPRGRTSHGNHGGQILLCLVRASVPLTLSFLI